VTTPADDEQPPEFAKGGLVLGPGGEDSIPVFLYPGERWYTAEQAWRFMAAKPGSRDALT
jgi:hypothetical protein